MSDSKLTPIRVPTELLEAVDRRVGPRRRSRFFVAAARRELARMLQADALEESAGAWRDEEHPDLPDSLEGMSEMLRRLRAEAERHPRGTWPLAISWRATS